MEKRTCKHLQLSYYRAWGRLRRGQRVFSLYLQQNRKLPLVAPLVALYAGQCRLSSEVGKVAEQGWGSSAVRWLKARTMLCC